jgi:hypothetical protein
VTSGHAFTVTVSADPTAFQLVGVLGQGPLGEAGPTATPPYQFTLTTPPDCDSGLYTLTAIGLTTSGSTVFSPSVTVDVEQADTPLQLGAGLSSLSFSYAGDSNMLAITGTFSDASIVGLTRLRAPLDEPFQWTMRGPGRPVQPT